MPALKGARRSGDKTRAAVEGISWGTTGEYNGPETKATWTRESAI